MIKFTSFQAVNVPNHVGTQTDVLVYALGEDGKIYFTDAYCKEGWNPLEDLTANPLPQSESERRMG